MQELASPLLPSLFLFSVALVAGVVNGIAGGGGLIVFPALLLTGISPISANTTSTAALWFGTAASTVAYRQELSEHRRELLVLSGISILGGILGADLLLHTPAANFARLVPYLLLIATLLLAMGQPVMRWLQHRQQFVRLPFTTILLLQFAIAIYGGFFGGGAGILMLAVLELMGLKNIHTMNAFKSWLATCHNAAALLHFMATGTIAWLPASVMAIGALLGGYGSASIARRVPAAWVRSFIIAVGLAMTAYSFLQ